MWRFDVDRQRSNIVSLPDGTVKLKSRWNDWWSIWNVNYSYRRYRSSVCRDRRLLDIPVRVRYSFTIRSSEFLNNILFISFVHFHGFAIKCSLCNRLMSLCYPSMVRLIAIGLVSGVKIPFDQFFEGLLLFFIQGEWLGYSFAKEKVQRCFCCGKSGYEALVGDIKTKEWM